MATNDPAQAAADPAMDAAAEEASAATASAATTSDEAEAATAAEPTLESVQAELQAAREEGQRYLGLAQRAQADYQNLKRRAEQEKVEAYDRGRGDLLLAAAPALDDLQRALSTLPEGGPTSEWLEGVQLVARNLENTLSGLGVERLHPAGQPFDPNEHEAVMQEPREDVAADTVTTVVRTGYRIGGRLVRPAQVVVARTP